MKVTCGSCSKVLRVEDWLADNVARCPKCDEVIRIPPKGSPDGANAVVLTTAEATDLLRRRADAGLVPSILPGEMSRSAAAAPGASSPPGGRPTNPKTEPLPAFLRHASASIHEEPEHRKTRPLPRPTSIPAAGVGGAKLPAAHPPAAPAGASSQPSQGSQGSRPAAMYGEEAEAAAQEEQLASEAAEESPRKFGLISPLVPIAFVGGLLVGFICGWLIGWATRGSHTNHDVASPPAAAQSADTARPTPPDDHRLLAPPPSPSPSPAAEVPAGPAAPPMPMFPRDKWLAEQPKGARAEVVKVDSVVVRVAGLTESWPPNFLYYPAPQGQAYVQIKATLKWTGFEPITFDLGGDKPGCWLLTHDGQVFDPLGKPRTTAAPGGDSPADPAAKVTLDKTNWTAEVNVLFLTPTPLPGQPVRLMFAGSQYAELPGEVREADPVVPGRSIAGQWEPVPNQTLPAQFGDAQNLKFLAALANADRSHAMQINASAGGGFAVTIDKANIHGTLKPRKGEPAYFDAALTMGREKATAVVRVCEGDKLMLIYFTNDKFGQFAYRRFEDKMPGE